MPETTMNENHFLSLRENEVRLSGKVGNVKQESVSARTRDFSHYQFRLCVLTADERHAPATLTPRQCVHDSANRLDLADATARR